MMKKTTTRIVHLLFSVLLLLVSVTVSASAQGYFVEGEITWVNRFGVVPAGPGDSRPAAAPCSIFSVVALDARSKRPVAYTDQGASPFQFSFPQRVTYVCKYSLKVPEDRDLYIMATMGSVQQLPKTDRDPYLITDLWIADGRVHKPPAGSERVFTGATHVTLSSGVTSKRVDFRMTFINSEASEKVMPTFFAGAWQAKWGGAFAMLLLQQTGAQVTGQLKVNSADFAFIREGIVVGNTLRFQVWRTRPMLRDEYMGTGELVMDAGGQSFTGNVLGTTSSGTFIGR